MLVGRAVLYEPTPIKGIRVFGSAIVDAVADDPARTEALFEVWSELEEQRKLS